ncbi:MAG TPA: UDP-N-acetylmuramoyl-tripeptide--D-alanyl-D-alanine ligase, partial [Acidobacteria bacterium]|nr:UDP-N-acetylmuramoyl-tripeptide--D-alanyl-D-alanine ligase [Acidobacteriota bacterium]
MRLTAGRIAEIVGGILEGDPSAVVTGAEVDSRRVQPGDLFVALPGAQRDGHAYVASALDHGAAALVRRSADLMAPRPGTALIRVGDPLAAYHRLAAVERRRRRWRVAGVSGSVGKTTTKEILARLLALTFTTGASEGNRNSTLGLPAELLSQPEEVEVFVAELGMSHPGELDMLGNIVHPDLLLYTRIASAHTEFFPDISGIVRAKAELLEHVTADGVVVLNGLDPHQQELAEQSPVRTVWFGAEDSAVWAAEVEEKGFLGSTFTLAVGGERFPVELPLAGLHQVENYLGAVAAALELGIDASRAAEAAGTLRAAPRRGRIFRLASGITVVDDSYNASPLAMERVLTLLAGSPGRRIAVLGEMYELGNLAWQAHRDIGALAAAACDLLVTVGEANAATMAGAAREAGMA